MAIEFKPDRGPRKKFWTKGKTLTCIFLLCLGGCIGGVVGVGRAYTSTIPRPVQGYHAYDGEIQSVRSELQSFGEACNRGERAELILTEDEMNALVFAEPELRGKFFVRIENARLFLDMCIPLKEVPYLWLFPTLSGRYFNATLSLKVSVVDGRPVMVSDQLTVEGKPMSAEFMRGFAGRNLLQRIKGSIRHLELRQGRLIIEH